MKCVRCLEETASRVAAAPDGSGAWEVYYCQRCNFCWRSSEEPEVIDPLRRNPLFQLDKVNIEEIEPILAIPPLKM